MRIILETSPSLDIPVQIIRPAGMRKALGSAPRGRVFQHRLPTFFTCDHNAPLRPAYTKATMFSPHAYIALLTPEILLDTPGSGPGGGWTGQGGCL